MATVAEDRTYVRDEWLKLYGRLPDANELETHAGYLQQGMPRSTWFTNIERNTADIYVRELYKTVLGRVPSDAEVASHVTALQSGAATREQVRASFTGSAEALLRPPAAPSTAGQEDAFAYLKSVLDGYGLGGLGNWAWEQLKGGLTTERISQNLRETPEYKQRFKGLEARRAAGLPAISEGEYIGYETSVRQLMRTAGLPADFYDSPEDFAGFIGKDVSVAEMQSRINEGYLAASQAPAEVRQQLRDLYNIGEGQLAAFFMDPDRALPLIERQFASAQISGAAQRTQYGALGQSEAERLAALGVSEQQAAQGFGALAESSQLFTGLPGEDAAAIDRQTQQAAVFGGDAAAKQAIEKRRAERIAQGSGARSFGVGQGGVVGLGVE
jgi:hypothetical protein